MFDNPAKPVEMKEKDHQSQENMFKIPAKPAEKFWITWDTLQNDKLKKRVTPIHEKPLNENTLNEVIEIKDEEKPN